jgi:hypothetical protein
VKANDTSLTFTKGELSALCLFASRDTTRHHLNAICFDPGRGLVFSTDGHRMLSWFGPHYAGPTRAIALGGFLRSLKVGSKDSTFSLALTGDPLLSVDDATFRLVVSSDTVPPALQVFPKKRATKHSPVSLQPSVLNGALEACRLLSGIKQCGFTFYSGSGPLEPVQLEFDQAKDWKALVMPMRGNAGVE